MLHRTRTLAIWLAAAPLVWGLAGCGGGDKPKAKPTPAPAKTDEGTPATTKPSSAGKSTAKEESVAAEGWGTIKGTVVFGGDVPAAVVLAEKGATKMKDGNDLKNAERCGEKELVSQELVVNQANKGIQWVMVSLNKPTSIADDLKNPTGGVELGQEFCVFQPHLLGIRQGQKFSVTSSDPIGHNTNLQPFKNPTWNQLLPPAAGAEKSVLVGPDYTAESKPIKVQCNIHGWMTAYLFVFDHPYFAVTDENGAFEIKSAPAGTQKLNVWQEKIGYGEGGATGKEITVKAGETTDLGQITLKTK